MEIQPIMKASWLKITTAAKWMMDPANRPAASIIGGIVLALLFVMWIL